jgi:23S rRNA pseudouridine955/2504/2580 synthase
LPVADGGAIVPGMMPWQIQPEEDGRELLTLLQLRLPAAPVGYLRQLLRRGDIRRNGQPLQAQSLVRAGDLLELPQSARLRALASTAPPPAVEILLETRELLVANKPSGLAVHRGVGHGDDNLLDRLERLLKERKARFSIAPVHRLDLETSGPVLFAKGRQAASDLGKLFIEGSGLEKLYLALVAGSLPASGVLTSTVPVRGKEKESATSYRTLQTAGGWSLLELTLHSGRTHQIRRQLADCGHPVAGDRRYRGPQGLPRLFLHCRRLSFPDPATQRPVVIDAPLPEELAKALELLGLDRPATQEER